MKRKLLTCVLSIIFLGVIFSAMKESVPDLLSLPPAQWTKVTIPDLPAGATLGQLWTGMRGEVYVWAQRQDPSTSIWECWIYKTSDGGSNWTVVLSVPGHYSNALWGASTSEIYASAYSSTLQENTPSSLMMPTSPSQKLVNFDVAAKSGVTASTTGFPMIDLGALVDPRPFSAYGVNNSGKVVGHAWAQEGGPPRAFLWFSQYGVMDLGTLGEPKYASANDINDRGQVVGCSYAPGTTQLRAFLWLDNGGMVNLGTSGEDPWGPENAFSIGFGINNRGEIVGCADNFAFLWTDRRGMVLLGSLRGFSDRTRFNAAWDINDNGWIVGMCMVYCCPPQYHAVLWTDVGKILDLGTLKLHSQALGINNRGEVVGGSSNQEFPFNHERIGSEDFNSVFDHSCVPFIWTEQYGMSQLPMLGGDAGSAHAINERGQVVGWSYTVANEVHAFVWTSKNGIKDLGTLPGDAESVAYGINNLGQVVGMSKNGTDGTRHAVIWTVR